MGFDGGIKAAAKMLSGLGSEERSRLLKIISDKNPEMAKILKENLVSFDDLIHITPKMLVEFLREVKVADLALAMRLASPELKNHVMKMLPAGIKKQIEDVLLGPPQLVSKAQEAKSQVEAVILKMSDEGRLVLRADGNDELV